MTNRTQYLVTLATLDGLAGVALTDPDSEIRERATNALIDAGRDGVDAIVSRSRQEAFGIAALAARS